MAGSASYQKAMGGISPARPTSPRQKARITTSELRRRGNSELASAQLPLSRRLDGFVAKPYQSRDGISLRLLRIREVRFAPIVFSNSGSGCQALQPSSLPDHCSLRGRDKQSACKVTLVVQCCNRGRSFRALAKNRTNSPSPSSRQGRLFPAV